MIPEGTRLEFAKLMVIVNKPDPGTPCLNNVTLNESTKKMK